MPIEVPPTLVNRFDTHRLAERLGVPIIQAAGHLVAFWSWALGGAGEEGKFDGIPPESIARGAQWGGGPEEFYSAMVATGFLVEDDGLLIADWHNLAGRHYADQRRRENNAARMRAKRAQHVQRTEGAPCSAQDAHSVRGASPPQGSPSPVPPLSPLPTSPATAAANAPARETDPDTAFGAVAKAIEELQGNRLVASAQSGRILADLRAGVEPALYLAKIREARDGARDPTWVFKGIANLRAEGVLTLAAYESLQAARQAATARDPPPNAQSTPRGGQRRVRSGHQQDWQHYVGSHPTRIDHILRGPPDSGGDDEAGQP